MSELDELLDPGVRNQSPISGGDGRLPHATAVLALGIISIVTCFFYGIPGLVCGIIALSLHKKDKAIYATDPARYEMAFKKFEGRFCLCGYRDFPVSALYAYFDFCIGLRDFYGLKILISRTAKQTLGFDCPTCGFQRSFIELIQGNFIDSFQSFPATIPLIITFFLLLSHLFLKWKHGAKLIMGSFIVSSSFIVINYSWHLATGAVWN